MIFERNLHEMGTDLIFRPEFTSPLYIRTSAGFTLVADLVAVLLPSQRFSRRMPQTLYCNFNNIDEISTGEAALGAGGRVFESLRPDQ
ncbi:MAG: hypothetical protein PHI97_31495 [Desulfobulbus sp.]|nr:hypothetical protein [Desulfobulbus sp.]